VAKAISKAAAKSKLASTQRAGTQRAGTKLARPKHGAARLTSSQTVGPFFTLGMARAELEVLWTPAVKGTRVRILGRVTDGKDTPVPDAMIEIWQAEADGHYAHPADRRAGKRDPVFVGFGRSGTDENGIYRFDTIKPGPVPGFGNTTQAPHLQVSVFARGVLDRLITRLYFPDEALNALDPVLCSIKEKNVRETLIAQADGDANGDRGVATYRFDIRLQGEGETAFFAA
jgi:protocatechuate 3,4-dioxygenase, alpha subunit